MEVIVFESDAFYKLVEMVTKPLVEELKEARRQLQEDKADIWMNEMDVMAALRITSKSWFSVYRAKNNFPCYKTGKKYAYKRREVLNFIEKHKTDR